jgi:hypothetical protein
MSETSDGPRMEQREVRSADPSLTAQTNARLTEELRDIVGAARVEVPVSRPRVAEGEVDENGRTGWLSQNVVTFLRLALIALTFGAIVALVTNLWWLLPLAVGVHALGTMAVTLGTVHLTTLSEHPSPTLAAAMTEEGVASADERFTALVDEFRSRQSGGVGEVLTPGGDERTVPASEDPAAAGAEQSTAMTPTGEPSREAPSGGTPDFIIWATLAGLLLASFIIPPLADDATMWLLPVVTVPLLAALAWLQLTMTRHPGRLQIHGVRPLVGITAAVVIAVAAFCVAVAIGMQT